MKLFLVTVKGKDSTQFVRVAAKDADEAKQIVEESNQRRHSRFELTFDRLAQAKETGRPGMLAIDPRFAGTALTDAWVKAETELRKRDQARYDDGELKITKVEEAK